MHLCIRYSVIYNSRDKEQPKCPLMDACIKKMCAYKMEYTQTYKGEIFPFATT